MRSRRSLLACLLAAALGLGVSDAPDSRPAPPRPVAVALPSLQVANELARDVRRPRAPAATAAPRVPILPALSFPILEYHYIRVNPDPRDRLGFNLSVTPAGFAAQLDWIAAHGYHPVTLTAIDAYFQHGFALPEHPIVLTFDDGYEDFYTAAFPALRQHGFVAVAYVVPGFLGSPGYMTESQLVELDQSGIEIAAHTVHHVNLVIQGELSLRTELEAGRAGLEGLLGHPVLDFCYPFGRFNPAVMAAVAAAGYLTATTQIPGLEHAWSQRLAWPRLEVYGGWTLGEYAARVANG